jgi:hypothetical protein
VDARVYQLPHPTRLQPAQLSVRARRRDRDALQTANQLCFIVPAQAVVARWLSTFKEFPPRQRSASFNVDAVVEKIMDAAAGMMRVVSLSSRDSCNSTY